MRKPSRKVGPLNARPGDVARQEAVQWLERLEKSETRVKRERFLAWLKASPVNVREFLQAKVLWEKSRYLIESDSAYIAVTMINCQGCKAPIRVICLCATDAVIEGEGHHEKDELIRLSHITAMDRYTTFLLSKVFPDFRLYVDDSGEPAEYANHCPQCGFIHEDDWLHDNSVFLTLAGAPEGSVGYQRIPRRIRVDATEGFELGEEIEDLQRRLRAGQGKKRSLASRQKRTSHRHLSRVPIKRLRRAKRRGR